MTSRVVAQLAQTNRILEVMLQENKTEQKLNNIEEAIINLTKAVENLTYMVSIK